MVIVLMTNGNGAVDGSCLPIEADKSTHSKGNSELTY